MADVNDVPLEERIFQFREAARFYARQAQQLATRDDPATAPAAALATMFLALAQDALTFGDMPEIDFDAMRGITPPLPRPDSP